MDTNPATASQKEFSEWERKLQAEGLGMDRGYNSSKVTYGWQ